MVRFKAAGMEFVTSCNSTGTINSILTDFPFKTQLNLNFFASISSYVGFFSQHFSFSCTTSLDDVTASNEFSH